MATSMHSLAHEAAFAAAKMAGKISQDIEAVASSGNTPDDHAPHQVAFMLTCIWVCHHAEAHSFVHVIMLRHIHWCTSGTFICAHHHRH